MSLITHLYGVFDDSYDLTSSYHGGSLPMSIAQPKHILERILICRQFVGRLRNSLQTPTSDQIREEFIKMLIEQQLEEIEELFDYYRIKVCSTAQQPIKTIGENKS